MRVASLINTHSLNHSSRSASSTSGESSGFGKVLGKATESSGRFEANAQTPSSPCHNSLPAASKHEGATGQTEKASSQTDASEKTHSKENIRSKPSTDLAIDAASSISSAQTEESSSPLLLQSPLTATSPQTTDGTGTTATSLPDGAQNNEASGSETSTSSPPDLGGAVLAESLEPAAGPSNSAVAVAPTARQPSTAAADPEDHSTGKATAESKESSIGSSASCAGLGPGSPAVALSSTSGTLQGPGTEALPAASALPLTGNASAKASVTGVQPSRNTKTSSAADTVAKHEGDGSPVTATDGSGNTAATPVAIPAVVSGNTPGDSPAYGQKDQTADLAAVQLQSASAIGSTSGATGSPTSSTVTPDTGGTAASSPSPASVPGSGSLAAGMPGVSSAQLIQSVRHAEMRLGMQSDEFGSMSISTTLGKQVLSAQISTGHLELGRALAAHLPAMEQKLSTAYGLPAKVEVNNGGSSSNTPSDGQSQSGRQQSVGSSAVQEVSGAVVTTAMTESQVGAAAVGSGRLDVRV